MMGQKSHKRIEVNSVSLVNLKAEIARRQVDVKSKATTLVDGCTIILHPPSSHVSDSTKSVFKRVQKSLKSAKQKREEQTPEEINDLSAAEQAELDRSRRNLEAKAKLYDALQQAATAPRAGATDDDKAPLVDFERKAMETGSTFYHYYDNGDTIKHFEKAEASPVSIPDGPLTYAHLRKGEVRDHGVGFYGFSEDAATRASEQAALRELHRTTEKARLATDQARAKRDIQMAKRLAKLRARKGLPDVATAAAKCLGKSIVQPTEKIDAVDPMASSSTGGLELSSNDLDIASMLRRLRDEAEVIQQQKQQLPISSTHHSQLKVTTSSLADPPISSTRKRGREWDRGKMALPAQHFVSAGQQHQPVVMTDRDPEFAPPPSFNRW